MSDYKETDTYKAAISIYLVTIESEGILLFFRNYNWHNRYEMLSVINSRLIL